MVLLLGINTKVPARSLKHFLYGMPRSSHKLRPVRLALWSFNEYLEPSVFCRAVLCQVLALALTLTLVPGICRET